MSIAAASINKRTVTVFTTAVLLFAGIASFKGLGQLEDPEFTVKTAAIITMYPGATAAEVELEVTDRLEIALQEMTQLKELESYSRAGMSLIKAYIQSDYTSDKLPQVWDELRKKIRDASANLPPGAGTPSVGDDYGDVYGFLMAVEGDGFTYAELEKYVDRIKKELSLVDGAARVELWGEQTEAIYLEVTQARLSQLGLLIEDVASTLATQNMVVDSGGLEIQDDRLRIETTGEFRDPEDIADLVIRGRRIRDVDDETRLIRIRDVAEVKRGYVEPPQKLMRFNGRPCIGVSVSNRSGVNIVDLGTALDARLEELSEELPVGIEIHRISWQSGLVEESIVAFLISLAQAVAIVLIVLLVAMGLRTAFIVGMTGLVFTIIMSFVFMAMLGIDLQRMSLGALVIAMGMMVDNAIVVADGVLVRLQQGQSPADAAREAATVPSVPLLGATIVAVAAFYPIAASDESAGEYCATLFSVIGISLMLSWVLSVTVAPVTCMMMLKPPKTTGGDAYGGALYRAFRGILRASMRLRWLVIVVLLGMLVAAGIGFKWVPQLFFPASARPQLMIDYWAPEGTRIQQVSSDIKPIEDWLREQPGVTALSTFIGAGPPRFYLPVDPENPYQSYAQFIVNVSGPEHIDPLMAAVSDYANSDVPQALLISRKYGLGPSETWPVEARFSGPAIADPVTLRRLALEAQAIIEASPHAQVVRSNWRQRTKKVVANYDENNARWTGVGRDDIAGATKRAFDGQTLGLYREGDKLLPILLRHIDRERHEFPGSIETLQVRPPMSESTVPLVQVTESIDVEWEDPLIWRWDRRRAITVQAVPVTLATTLRNDIRAQIEAIELPPGYRLMWDGEFRSSSDAQASLIPGMIPAGILVALICVGLFNAYRPPLIIACVIPFAMIGVTVGLLATRQPFGFVALLGAMSLVGMMIKNAIVLLDQINIEKDAGKGDYDAIVDAALSRLRPVLLAAATTVLGVIPLLPDVFWKSMAVTIMFGLTFGSVLTMIAIPVLYAIFYKVKVPPASS